MHSTDALPLPSRPDIEQYKKLAKELLAAVKSGSQEPVESWARSWIAWLIEHAPAGRDEMRSDQWIARSAGDFARYWSGERKVRDIPPPRQTLAHAQYIIARVQGFASWAELARYIDAVARRDSGVARFETAVDAIVSGDIETLRRLLREHPDLTDARSSRAHHATLLHYVSANGVEGYRQKTPPNIVEITKLLLASGADVNATAHCYGEHDDTLGLTATSVHPANAGVMIPMLETLVAAGAQVNRESNGWGIIRACIANGQPEAAAWLADHGARIGLAEAFGIGRMDVIQKFLAPDGSLLNGATEAQLEEGFRNASWYRHVDAIRYLLDAGFDMRRQFADGETALHHAAYDGHPETVELLLARGARTDVREQQHGGTPWDWAEHASRKRQNLPPGTDYARVMAILEAAARR